LENLRISGFEKGTEIEKKELKGPYGKKDFVSSWRMYGDLDYF
jgi:hypothetical protein